MIKIIIISLIFFVSISEKNLINSNKNKSFFPRWKWYNKKNYIGKNWFLKNPFAMLSNGWHFWEFITFISFSYLIALELNNLLYGLLVYVLGGLYISLRNQSLFRKGLNI